MAQLTDSPTRWSPRRSDVGDHALARAGTFLVSLLLLLVSALPIAHFLGVALQRVGYPYDLEWCEGGIIGHIRMVLAGHQPYRAPSLEFTPYFYPPLYYYVSAIPALFLGAGHLAPRLVSFLSILGCFVLLGRWVRDETNDAVAGVAAIGVLSATYQLTGFWFELARVDSFFLLLVLSGLMLARDAKKTSRAVIVGVLLAAACFTKQLGIPLALPTLFLLALRSFRLAVIAALVSGALLLVFGFALNLASHGWFLYYMLDLPSRHQVEWERFLPSLQSYFLGVTFPMTLAGIAIVFGLGFRRQAWQSWLVHALFIALACSTSFLPFLKSGGYPNGLIPGYTALALASGLVIAALRRAHGPVLGKLGPQLLACFTLAVQLLLLNYDAAPALPTQADLEANVKVMARLKALEKPLFVTGSSFYTMTAGDAPVMTDTMGLIDIYKGGGVQAQDLDAVLTRAIREHRFKTIVTDRVSGFLPGNIVALIYQEYVPTGSVLSGLAPDVIWPKSGAWLRPDQIWVPRQR